LKVVSSFKYNNNGYSPIFLMVLFCDFQYVNERFFCHFLLFSECLLSC
jgi:hypothetical protein